MEASDADRRKEWSTSQSGMTQTVGTDADIIGVPRSVLAAACYIIRNSEHAESETAKAMREYALATQSAELDALRGEVERKEAERVALWNEVRDLKSSLLVHHAANAQLRDRVAGLEKSIAPSERGAVLIIRVDEFDCPNELNIIQHQSSYHLKCGSKASPERVWYVIQDEFSHANVDFGKYHGSRALLKQNEVG